MRLHGYYRSSAAWRVRIALNLKGVAVEHVAHHLRRGEQMAAAFLRLNPQGIVPVLELDVGRVLTQSLAICEWLDETYRQPPLLPADPFERAQVRAFALAIACEIHPVQNLKVLARLRESIGIAARARERRQQRFDEFGNHHRGRPHAIVADAAAGVAQVQTLARG